MVLAFPGPDTATGEDVVELHCHGSRAVIDSVERALTAVPGCRRAAPGEFTRRALRNGRIDLAQAEALGDLLRAETEGQRRNALRGTEGTLGRAIARWRELLIQQGALIEAALAFEDEQEVALGASLDRAVLEKVASEMRALLAQPPVERLHDGIRVVLAGPPNAGKSTLLNALVGREVAIVTPVAGTTRDRIEVPVQRDGIAYLLTDTAGLRESEDAIERLGITRAKAAIEQADIILWLGEDPAPLAAGLVIELHARSDLKDRPAPDGRLAVSGRTGEGLPSLWAVIGSYARGLLPVEGDVAVNRRQRALVSEAEVALTAALRMPDDIFVAEELRVSLAALDRINGKAGVEAILDAVFSTFCLGK